MGWSANSNKTKEIVKTFKDHGPQRRNESECQECTCKIHKSLNRRMCIKFESRKICVAANQCDNSEHKELPVIKISSDEGREDCQQLKPKGTQASLGTTVITVTILLILSILFSRVTVNVLFLFCSLCFSCNCVYCYAVPVRCSASGFCIVSKFCVKSVLMSVR